MFKQRTIEATIKAVDSNFKALLLTGMRQIGKTTILQYLIDNDRIYITLDDISLLKLAKEDSFLFFQTYQAPLLIDEIQYAPDKINQPGQVWMTGSQHFLLMKGVTESLAGRLSVLEMRANAISVWDI